MPLNLGLYLLRCFRVLLTSLAKGNDQQLSKLLLLAELIKRLCVALCNLKHFLEKKLILRCQHRILFPSFPCVLNGTAELKSAKFLTLGLRLNSVQHSQQWNSDSLSDVFCSSLNNWLHCMFWVEFWYSW